MPIDTACLACKHWDKSAYPKNPMYGKCRFPILASIGPQPFWAPIVTPDKATASYEGRMCPTWEKKA